jgi:plastocyanin
MRTRWRRRCVGLLLLGLLGTMIPVAPVGAAPAADIDGNTYTSPRFGYTVTWDDSWFVASDESDGSGDYLALVNGTTSAVFAGFRDGAGVTSCIASLITGLGLAGLLEDVEPVIGDDGAAIRGEAGGHAYAAITGTTTFDDGSTVALAAYLDCQPIVPGESLLSLVGFMPVELFAGQMPRLQTLLDGVVMPGGDPGGVDDPTGTLEDDEGAAGEPAPVFAAGRWRVAVAGAVRDESIEPADLEAKAGKEWIVVVADVTNWSDDDATFTADELGLAFADDGRRYEPAPNSSRAAGRALDLEQIEVGEGVEIEAGETVRLALAFLVPADGTAPTLHGTMSEPGLPLAPSSGAALLDVRPPSAPPTLQAVDVLAAIDGEVVEIRVAGAQESVRARLIGVDAPATGACFDDWSTSRLSLLDSTRTWIERDPTQRSGATEKVYLWAENPNGNRVLINQQQVADGYAVARPLGEETRFAAWIGEAARTAQTGRVGLWRSCEQAATPAATSEPDATRTPSPRNTTETGDAATATATAEATRTPTPERLPDEVTIEAFDIGYRPEQVTVAAETEVTITVVNAGATEHTFSIDELHVSISVPAGEDETFTLTLPGGDYVYYCERPGHRADGMEGVLHVE